MAKYKQIYILILSAMLLVLPFFDVVNADEQLTCITFSHDKLNVKYVDRKIKSTNHLVTEDIFYRGINLDRQGKNQIIADLLSKGASPKKAVLYCYPLLEKTIDILINSINCNSVDSSISFNPDKKPMFTITNDKIGASIDLQRLYYDIILSLRMENNPVIKLKVTPILPTVTVKDNILNTRKISSFSTDYSGSSQDRKHNIRLALSKINGYVLKPNQTLEFNKVVGRRSKDNGFKEAKIIVGGKYVKGVGGGVCQASTTLYNSALLADMNILSVHNHSLPCSYVPPSFDAMVNSGSSDLVIENTKKTNIYIRSFCDDEKVTVEFYGNSLPYTIKRKSVIIKKLPIPEDKVIIDNKNDYFDDLAKSGDMKYIQFPHQGLISEGYLYYYKKGLLVKTKKIRNDKYYSSQGVLAVYP